jgi:hypothetical protein
MRHDTMMIITHSVLKEDTFSACTTSRPPDPVAIVTAEQQEVTDGLNSLPGTRPPLAIGILLSLA